MSTFQNRRILVTGAGQGIGRGIVKELVRLGGEVVAVSRTKSHLDSLQAELPSIRTVALDIADWDATRAALTPLGPFHHLVNNAAQIVREKFLDIKPETFDQLFSVNVKAVLNISQIVAKDMIKHKIKGSIVNVSSIVSQAALRDLCVYSSTKAALDMLSKAMALELGEHGVRVNCVNPTVVMTEMGRKFWTDPSKLRILTDKIPLRRVAEVEEVAAAVVFLLSDESSMVNGALLPVDGGFLATRML